HLRLGVAVVHLPSGQSANVRAGQQFPLASVAKLPLLFAAAHALHCPCPCHSTHHPHAPAAPFASCSSGSSNEWPALRGLSLKTMLHVRDEDKCIGSGLMRSLPSGMAVAVQQCLWLMNCISDNTAADLVFKAVGWPCVTGLLQAHGAHSTSVHLTQRQAFLLALGFSSELRQPYGPPRARSWQGMSVAQQRQVAERVEGESRAVSVRDLSAVEEASLLLQRAQGDKGYRNDSHIAAAMDNRGSPADMAGLLCKLSTARLLPWPRATALCLHTMAMQVYGQRRLPYYLPPATTVLHKTGSILGTVNAAGIIPLPRPPPTLHSHQMRHHLTRLPLLPAVQASPRPSSPVTTLFSSPLRSSAHLPGYEHAEQGVGAESLQVGEGGAVVVAAFVDQLGAGGPRTCRQKPLSLQQLCKRAVRWDSLSGGAWCATTGGPCESTPASSAAGRRGGSRGGQQRQQRSPETLSPQQLREWAVRWGSPGGGAWGTSAGGGEAPGGVEAASLGAFDSASTGAELEEALHTFTLDSGTSCCFFRDSTTVTPLRVPVLVTLADPSGGPVVARGATVLPCPAAPSGLLTGPRLPSFDKNLVATSVLQDPWVTVTQPGGELVAICTDLCTGEHLATFTRRPGSGLYTLTTESALVAESGQVAASLEVASSCSCRLLMHQTLL
ncbi:unnamed protein product, partial [Closterium sp. NIES-54]